MAVKKTYLGRMCIHSSSMLNSIGPYSGPRLNDAGERDGQGAGGQTKKSVFLEGSCPIGYQFPQILTTDQVCGAYETTLH